MDQVSTQNYKLFLMSNDINESFMRTLNELKAYLEEFKLTNRCSLSKQLIKIPIRHNDLKSLGCIFDLEVFLVYIQSKPQTNMENQFKCPGCQTQTNLQGYGVHRNHYNFLELLNHYMKKNLLEEKKIQKDFVYLQIINNEQYYYVKNRIDQSKIRIPGTTPILEITKRRYQYQQQNKIFSEEQKRISDQLSANIQIFQNYMQKLYLMHNQNRNRQVEFNHQNREQKDEIIKEFNNSIKIQVINQQSIQQDFVFLFVETPKNQNSQNTEFETYLLVYYVYNNVWKQFLIEFNNQQFRILQQSLYIKQKGEHENYIYIIGGKYKKEYNTSNQVYRIAITKNPLDNKQTTVKKLPDIPQSGYHYLGTEYNKKIYIFYGQQIEVTDEGDIENNLFNRGYVFYDNNWTDLKLSLEPRFDGSFFTYTDGNNEKQILFFGGLTDTPNGVANTMVPQQNKVQIFNLQTEKLQLFGQGNKNFYQLNFQEFTQQQQRYVKILCFPVVSFPHYNGNQLIVSGVNYQEENDHTQIYSFKQQTQNIKLNNLFSLTPLENNFTLVKKQDYEYFSPVQDPEGSKVFGYYYTLSHYYEKNLPIFKLLRINLAFGQIQYLNQQDIQNLNRYYNLFKEQNQIIQTNNNFRQSQN